MGEGHANTNQAVTSSRDRAARPFAVGLGPNGLEADEKGPHDCRVEHFESPFSTVCALTQPSTTDVRESNTCR
jgi:hypothetical protein